MTKLILQNIIFDSVMDAAKELYWRCKKDFYLKNGIMYLSKDTGPVYTNTYFNAFFPLTWIKYTNIGQLYIELEYMGCVEICMYGCGIEEETSKVTRRIIFKEHLESNKITSVYLPIDIHADTMIYFSLNGVSEKTQISGIRYFTLVPRVNKVNIMLDLCTYRREQDITKNLSRIQQKIVSNPKSALASHMYVTVIDNGQTLTNDFGISQLKLITQKDFGSTGGYTRGMLEALARKEEYALTHVILMDDDIVIEPEILERNFALLSILRKEYQKSFVGGTMLWQDNPYIQQETGGFFDGEKLIGDRAWESMNDEEQLLYNCIHEDSINYMGWWYCCIPMSCIKESNLPFPFYMRWDDVEYGYRNRSEKFIHINGLGVWHASFENKYNSAMLYYEMRNYLIMCALEQSLDYCTMIKRIALYVYREICRYRYRDAELVLKGVRDFLRGPEWLRALKTDEFHEQILAHGYRLQKISVEQIKPEWEDLRNEEKEISSQTYAKGNESGGIRRVLMRLFDPFIPAKGVRILRIDNNRLKNYNGTRYILNYDIATEKGFWVEKSFQKHFQDCIKLIGVTVCFLFQYKTVARRYQNQKHVMTDLKFWQHYLDVDIQE